MGAADRGDHRREGPGHLRAEGRRGPPLLVAAGHQRRRPEVLPRQPWQPRARDQRPPDHRPSGRHPRDAGAVEGGYFATDEDAENWAEELRFLLVTQHASFNSPVWFNIGVPGRSQQGSACFINSVQDSMESILDLVKTEGMLFKFGSGTGTNLSVLRSSREQLSGGGTASGPVSFMRGYDSFAGSIKSGGTTRRAAKMVILNADHPDVARLHPLQGGGREEGLGADRGRLQRGLQRARRARTTRSSSRTPTTRSDVTDDFMRAVIDDKEWQTHAVVDGRVVDTYKARDAVARDRRRGVDLRRPRPAVRHHHPGLERRPEHRPHQRDQPVLRVRLP